MLTVTAVALFLKSRAAKNCRPRTIKWYGHILSVFEVRYPELPLTPEPLEEFIASSPGGDERRHGYFRTLRAFYRFLEKRQAFDNPMSKLDAPRRSRKLPKALSLEDFHRLFDFPHPPHARAYLRFLADTGARIGELLVLKPEHIRRTDSGYVALICGKTGERFAPMLEGTYHELLAHLPVAYSENGLGKLIRRAFRNAGVRGSAHSLRHTFASLWSGNESALMAILGHSSYEMMKHYRQLRTRQLSEAHRSATPVLLLR